MPLGVVLGVPLGVFGAMLFIWNSGAPNDVYSSIGLVLLVGLIAKNAVLIVEYAAQQRREGKSIREAAVESAHLRLRPVLMTAFSFILGVLPLMLSSGAGAASRVSLGTTVFGGMLIGTILGVLVVPAFYVVFQRLSEWWHPVPAVAASEGQVEQIHTGD
jgi:HAE1 family hydrophobic/amphiphilic exporter-1